MPAQPKPILESRSVYREPLGFVNSGEPQSGPDLNDHEEIDIASISMTNDRSKMDRYDGPPNSLNLTVRGIEIGGHLCGSKD
jgi:hypothetical protein